MPNVFLFFLLITPVSEGWDLLSQATVIAANDDPVGVPMETLEFSDEIRQAAGNEIELTGYVIPLETTRATTYFVVSRYPFQSCFFCGAAGPETVAEVYASTQIDQTDQRILVRGILQLNEDDPLHLPYLIKDAKVKILD